MPFIPVLIVRKISSGVLPPEGPTLRKVSRAKGIAPVVFQGRRRRPVAPTEVPWHLTQPFSSKSFFPRSTVSFVAPGAPAEAPAGERFRLREV